MMACGVSSKASCVLLLVFYNFTYITYLNLSMACVSSCFIIVNIYKTSCIKVYKIVLAFLFTNAYRVFAYR